MFEEKKRLPVGVENFEQMIKENYYYVDKWRNGKSLYPTEAFWKNIKYEYVGAFFFH